jgi:hypothetical protein
MISFKYKFIFIHAPKTAGNSIQYVLQKYSSDEVVNVRYKDGVLDKFGVQNFAGGKHATINHYIKNWNTEYGRLEDYTVSGCVRNPWDRATSYYFYLGNCNFNCDTFAKTSGQLSSQTSYYCANENNMLTCPISYENLQTDFNKFCDIVGIPREELPKANVSKRKTKHYTEYYQKCKNANDVIVNRFSKDITNFGYNDGR